MIGRWWSGEETSSVVWASCLLLLHGLLGCVAAGSLCFAASCSADALPPLETLVDALPQYDMSLLWRIHFLHALSV